MRFERREQFAATNPVRLERWLGAGGVQHVQHAMRDWYGPPIGVAGVPGNVHVTADGDFFGEIKAGEECSFWDRAEDIKRRMARAIRIATSPRRAQLNMGFSSLSDLISEASAGKRYEWQFNKAGPTGVANVTSSLWRLGTTPAAGSAPAAAAAGTAFTSASTGGFPFTNPTAGDTQHFVAGFPLASVAGNTLLLYDLLFGVAKTMNATTTEAVTGTLTRYQSSTGTDPDYIGGNFCAIHVGGTALAATGHNWTVCQYTNQAGSTGQSFPSLTGNSGAIVDRLDHPTNQWFMPLASGDNGVKALTQMQCSAAVATGVIWFMIGHPIAWLPCPVANMVCTIDGLNSAFNLARIFDSACLAFLEVIKPSTTATNYTGSFTSVAG